MPTAEANSYELAFHVLPTVVEGEVATIFQSLKDAITKHGGELGPEEAPARVDLAYEIVKYLEGRNRKFSSAYFGWVRFTATPDAVAHIDAAARETKDLLRYMVIKLTKVEEANPFYYHEALAAEAKATTIDVDEETAVVAEVETTTETEATAEAEEETESTDKV